jgi:branched-chain amino acid transport system substrate-binding protein
MASMTTSIRRNRQRAVGAVLLAVMTAGAGACGNRLSEDRLRADAGINPGNQQAAAGSAAVLPGPETTASTAASDSGPATAADAGTTSGSPAAATPAGTANPASPSGAAQAASGSVKAAKTAAGAAKTGSDGGGAATKTSGPAGEPSGGASTGSGGRKTVPGGGTPGGGGQAAPTAGGSCTGTKAPIVIGSVGEYSGLLGPILAPGVKSVQAWAAATNAKGGLNCHPVKLVVYDAGGDPSRNQALTQRAVEQDKVIAFVYNGAALSGQASAEYLKQRRIPVVGEEGAQPWVCYSPNGFPIMSSCNEGIQGIYQTLAQVIKPGEKVAAITCNEVPFCTGYTNNAEKYSKEAGFKLVYNGSVSMTQPDYTSACVQAKNAGAQALALGMVDSAANRVKRSCKSVGLDVPIISNGTAFSAAKPGDGMDGAWIASGVRFTPPSHPAVAEWLAALKQYLPGTGASANGGIGWVSAKVFELAAKAMPDTPTSQAVLEGLWTIKGNDIGGMTRPLTYVKDQPAVQTPGCWFPAKMDDSRGGWTGDYRVCL